ncbi:mannitol dehydrogenase family protein [Novosphingobium tardum]|uniref:Mannitol dehydrogenase family protein n=1 Tax=Novosphingobium tardum TaxID=1538021 RepID=A0ABV8RSI4_9SPHN
MRLSAATVGRLAPEVERFAYDRQLQKPGIVHFGIGAFHRAHQAWYTDRAMDCGDRDWAIFGVSLRSPEVARQMNPQDGLYTLTERSAAGDATRLIGAVAKVIVASEQTEAVIAALAAPTTSIASLTITEKGYCRAADGSLDPALASESSVYRYLAAGLRRRREASLRGLTLLSCDNLADNGTQTARLMGEYLERHDPTLATWFADECTCPATMVDRIVPATTAADRDRLADRIGLRDDAAVITEPFTQWVMEDRFAGPRPRWEAVGAELVGDVAAYENAKLRLLNGAHSALAYLGLERGHTFVHEAVADPGLRILIERLMREEALPTLSAAPGQDLSAYIDALLARFANPALEHRLIQIAMDGSQKIPQRWLATLADNQRRGRACPALLAALAAWLRHVRGDNVARWGLVDDPLAPALATAWQGGDPAAALFSAQGQFADIWTMSDDAHAVLAADQGDRQPS